MKDSRHTPTSSTQWISKMTVDIPDRPRKHRWVTEAISQGELILSVWPSPDEITNKAKQKRFLETVAKVGNDPRVTNVRKVPHDDYTVVYLFDLDVNA